MLKYLVIFIFCIGASVVTIAQQKYEKEFDLDRNDVPRLALNFIESVEIDSKVNWYYEENLKGNSVEAKFSHAGQKYSIEFDTTGTLQDIELEIALEEIAEETMLQMKESLNHEFDKSSIHRVQKQYAGTVKSFKAFLNVDRSISYEMRYEAEVKGKKNKRMRLFEVLFSSDGSIERIDEIIFRNNDYLEF